MAQLQIIRKELSVNDLKFLAMLKNSVYSFINDVNKSNFPFSIIDKVGDLETFYHKVQNEVQYDL